jgi:hypothetical protein
MKNFAWINTETDLVENVIYYDGVTPIELPEGIILIEIPEEGIIGSWSMLSPGWSYIEGQFVEPPQPERPSQPTTIGSQTL